MYSKKRGGRPFHDYSSGGAVRLALIFLAATLMSIGSCKTLSSDDGKHGIIVPGKFSLKDHPDASYYFLSSAGATDDDGSLAEQTLTPGPQAAAIAQMAPPELIATDFVYITGEIFLKPQNDLISQPIPARLNLTLGDGGVPVGSRLVNLTNQSYGRSFQVNALVTGKNLAGQTILLQLASAAPVPRETGPLRIAHARIQALRFRSVKRQTVTGSPDGYLLVAQKDVYAPQVTNLSTDSKPLFELTNLTLKQGDLLIVSHQWELDAGTPDASCSGAWADAWLTLNESQSGLAAASRQLPSAPRQRRFTGSVVLTAALNGSYDLRMNTHISDARCSLPLVDSASHFMVQQFRPLATEGLDPTQGWYLYRLTGTATPAATSLKVRSNRTVGDLLTIATESLATGDLLSFWANATIASDFDTAATHTALQVVGVHDDPRTAIRTDTIDKGWPRVDLEVQGCYAPADSAAGTQESLVVKLAAQNLLSQPLWVESVGMVLHHFRKIPAVEMDGLDAGGGLSAQVAAAPASGVPPAVSSIFKEISKCGLFAFSSAGETVTGGPPVAIPLPLSQYGGTLAVDAAGRETYTVRIRAGQSYGLQGPWIVYTTDQPTPSGYSEVFYDIVVSNPRDATCRAQASQA